jgi:hypothetical protein
MTSHPFDESESESAPAPEVERRAPIRRDASWPKPASQAVWKVLQKFPGADLALLQLQQQWADIIGRPYCDWCQADKIVAPKTGGGAVLHLRVMGAAALELQHIQPQLIEKINRYAGYGWIRDIRMVQGMTPKAAAITKPAPQAPSKTGQTQLPQITDPELRAILERLGDGASE